MIKKIKKGFTLVELVVVIAVIAILAAVSVVAYIGITRKAQESNDKLVIDQVNKVLTASTISGEKRSVHGVVTNLLKDEGFDVREIAPELEGTEFVYLFEENKFGYWKGESVIYPKDIEGTVKSANVWFFRDITGTSGVYNTPDDASYYIKSIDSETTVINSKGGIDVGETSVANINYKRTNSAEHTVIFRTNGGALSIDSEYDTVEHYGDADRISLKAVSSQSYYEHGKVEQVNIKKGRLVLTNSADSSVGTVYLESTNDSYDNIILATQAGADLPENIARDSVTLPTGSDSKTVVTIQTNVNSEGKSPEKVETINLYATAGSTGNDVYEENNGYNVSALALLVVEASSDEKKAQAAEQISDPAVVEQVTETKSAWEVDSEQELTDALAAKAKYIIVTGSFDTTKAFLIKGSTIIEGAKLSNDTYPVITSKATVQSEKRGFRVAESNLSVTLRNLTVDVRSNVTSDGGYPRGLQIDSNRVGVKLIVENCDISATHYAFNVCDGADVDATFINSHLLGYGALNLWHANYHVKVSNSVLEGIQNAREGFGVIILEGDVTGQTNMHSSSITVQIDNSEIIATCNNTTGGYEAFVGFNTGAVGNIVSLTNCKFTSKGAGITKGYYNLGEANSLLLEGKEAILNSLQVDFSGVTINEDGKTATGTVKFIVNGTTISYNMSSATTSDWGEGTDYLFEYNVGSLKYVFDLDISMIHYSENNGWAIYPSCNF